MALWKVLRSFTIEEVSIVTSHEAQAVIEQSSETETIYIEGEVVDDTKIALHTAALLEGGFIARPRQKRAAQKETIQ